MNKKDTERYKLLASINHDLCVSMQAAWIEWRHGKGAEAAMGWIQNTLTGPGLIPDSEAPYGKEAQAWMDSQRSEPLPECSCGRRSHIGWMGKGFCSEEHYAAAKAASLN